MWDMDKAQKHTYFWSLNNDRPLQHKPAFLSSKILFVRSRHKFNFPTLKFKLEFGL